MTDPFLKLAYVSRSHGIKGEIFVQPFNPRAHWPEKISSIKIGELMFSIERYSAHKQGFIFKLKGCDSKESADQLKAQPVFLSKNYFISKKGDDIYLAELLGFEVETVRGEKGRALEFQTDKYQDFLTVAFSSSGDSDRDQSSSVCLIPFVSAYIKTIDFENKKLVLNLPENFLSLFKK